MFLRSLFRDGGDERGRYPKSHIEAAIERAVDGTDSRLRLLPGYRKRLLDPVVAAIDHAVALVDALPEPVVASRQAYREDPQLAAVFASSESMLEELGRDLRLRDFLAGPGRAVDRVTALLRAELAEKHIFGRDLVDGQMRRDVPQVAVSFTGHRLADPAGSELETRRLLKQRTFDHLVTLALGRLTSVQIERADLTRQRDLLRRKLSNLERGDLSFDRPAEPGFPDQRVLRAELERITHQLHILGTDDKVLRAHLGIVADTLGDATHQLWSRDIGLHLDAMNIKRHHRDPSGRRVVLRELRDADGHCSILLLLTFAPGDLPPPEDFLTAAERFLRSSP